MFFILGENGIFAHYYSSNTLQMAILNKIRSKGIFLIIIIALALFAFIFSSILDNGGFNADKQNRVASINGVNLDREDFSRKVELQNRNQGGRGTQTSAVNAVWNQEVNRVVLEEQYEELGIVVSRDRLNELLKTTFQNEPTFQDDTGFFSELKLQEYIATIKDSNPTAYQQWLETEKSLVNTEKQNIYYNLVKAGVGATLKDGEVAYKLDGNKVDIQFVQIPYTSLPDEDFEVGKEEIASYIKNHKDEFKTEASRSIRYVKFEEKASLEDENELKQTMAGLLKQRIVPNGATRLNDTLPGFAAVQDIEGFISENSDLPYQDRFFLKNQLSKTVADTLIQMEAGAIYGPYKDGNYMKLDRVIATKQVPDSVNTRHILLAYQGALRSQATRTKEEAQATGDSLLAVIKRNKSKFGELAKEFSDDRGSKDNGGEYKNTAYGQFAAEYNDFAFEGRVGDLDLVETDFGFHIIEVQKQIGSSKSMKIATVAKEILASDKTISDTYNTTQKFEIAAREGDFAEVAKEKGYAVRPVSRMLAMEENLPGEGSQREIVQWSFEEDTKVGEIKRFQTNAGYIVAQVTAKRKKGLQAVEDVSGRVLPILRNEKKANKIIAGLSGSTLEEIASSQGQTVKTAGALNMGSTTIAGAGDEPKVVGAAFAIKEGELSPPVAGAKGVYVLKATKITEAPVLDNYGVYANQASNAARAGVTTKVLEALKAAADIEDNRAAFY